jgi:hypothetical protein
MQLQTNKLSFSISPEKKNRKVGNGGSSNVEKTEKIYSNFLKPNNLIHDLSWNPVYIFFFCNGEKKF